MKGLLPDSILNRPKMGFPCPSPAGRAAVERRRARRAPRSPLAQRGLIDAQAVERLLGDHAAGRTDGGDRILEPAEPRALVRTFIDKEGIQTLPDAHPLAEIGSAAAA
jgi:hypothetical protein